MKRGILIVAVAAAAIAFAAAAIAVSRAIAAITAKDTFSIIHDPPLKCNYAKAYYYELDNLAFENALRLTFSTASSKQPNNGPRLANTSVSSDHVEAIRNYILKQMNDQLDKAFALPGDITAPFQMVDETVTYVQQLDKSKTAITLDAIIYRFAKYHGKHVRFIVHLQKQPLRTIRVVDAHVIGVVAEDKIAMFPVKASDFQNIDLMYSTASFKDDKTLPDNDVVLETVVRQNERLVSRITSG